MNVMLLLAQVAPALTDSIAGANPVPVSYTHLTLPTIA